MRARTSTKAARFTESVIREMSRVCREQGGVNLAQGFPDFAAPEPMKEAAVRAIRGDVNQYAVTWGAPRLRAAIAARTSAYNGIPTDPDAHVTVCCGATEAMIATLMAVLDPGDEVVIFEPFYENYGPDCVLSGATPRFVRLHPPDWSLDPGELAAAFGPRTRAVIVNTPHNPTGKVFSRAELEQIARLCVEHDVLAITDEIYEYILYDGHTHVSLATLPGMGERTITISGLSKTWSATGWRIGWAVAPPDITGAIRKVHDFLTVGAAAPLQEAAADALGAGPEYFDGLRRDYTARRDALLPVLEELGLRAFPPGGAYYALCDFSGLEPSDGAGRGGSASHPALAGLSDLDDVAFARALVEGGGVAAVPGSSFFADPARGRGWIRFCFAKRLETLERAAAILRARLGRRP